MRERRESLLLRLRDNKEKTRAARELARRLEGELEQSAAPAGDLAGAESSALELTDSLLKKVTALKSRLAAVEKAGEALTHTDRKCPLAPDHLQCALSGEQLDAVLISLRKEHRLTSQDLQNHERALVEAREELVGIRKRQEENRARAARVEELKKRLDAQRTLAGNLLAEKNALEKEREGLPDGQGQAGSEEELERLTGLIAEGEKSLARLVEAGALAEKRAVLQRDIETFTAELADLEVLVKALGPDGLRRDMLAGILDGFTGRVNDRLGRLTEGAYQVSLGSEMDILCRANGGPVLPLKLLSKSEQLRAGIAVSEALSAAAGLKFLAIDEADMLEQDNRDLLAGMLLDTAEEFDQVLVFTTVGDVKPENPGLPGVKIFWVEEGAVREI